MTRLSSWVIIAIIAVGLIGGVQGAERLGKYEITLLYSGKDYDSVSRTFRTIGEPYDSKVACDVAITRVKVLVSGARLRCDPVESFRVR